MTPISPDSYTTLVDATVDDALRVFLSRTAEESAGPDWTFPTSGAGGLRPGVNLDDRESLVELLGDNNAAS